MQSIIKRPVITEKTLASAAIGWYTFAVPLSARKEHISKAVAESYKVDVLEVRTRTMHGKIHRVGKKMAQIARQDWKKAAVRLKAGQHIDVFETVQQQVSEVKKEVKKEVKAKK